MLPPRLFLIPFGLLLWALPSAAMAETIELRHDTLEAHTNAGAVCGFVKGEGLGVRFTPPAYPATLLRVKLLLFNVPLSPSKCAEGAVSKEVVWPLEIFHTTAEIPGDSLIKLGGQMSNEKVLNVLDVSSSPISIDDGSFFVSFTLDTSDTSPVHDASGEAKLEENYLFGDIGSGPAWHSFSSLGKFAPGGNWVLRVDVDVPDGSGVGGASGAAGSGGDAGAAGAGVAEEAGSGGENAGQGGQQAGAGAGGEGTAGSSGEISGSSGQSGSNGAGIGGAAGSGAGPTSTAAPEEDSGCSSSGRGARSLWGAGFLVGLLALARRRWARG